MLLIFSSNSAYDFDANGALPNNASVCTKTMGSRLLQKNNYAIITEYFIIKKIKKVIQLSNLNKLLHTDTQIDRQIDR